MRAAPASGRSGAAVSLAPTPFEKALGLGAAVLLAVVVTAILRGQAQWAHVPTLIWAHLLTIIAALALTPVILWKRRGGQLHRRLGYAWLTSLTLTAALSFGIRTGKGGHFSAIHILSAFTLAQVPLIVWYARTRRIAAHRTAVCIMTSGALLIAGFFTFPFGRLLGRWLFG